MQDNNEAGASPARVDRLDELQRLCGLEESRWDSYEVEMIAWAVAEIKRLRLEVMARDVLLERSEALGLEEACLCADCVTEKLVGIRAELAAL